MRRRPVDPSTLASFLAALAPVGLAACGSVVGEFDESVCLYDSGLSDLSPGSADYVALRTQNNFDPEAEILIMSEFGVPCSGSSDSTICNAELDALGMDPPLLESNGFDGGARYDVVFTTGDEIGRITERAQLIELLGEIDTPTEAVLVAFVDGHNVPCGRQTARAEGSSFVLLGSRGSGCGEGDDVEEYEITVDTSGNVTVGESEIVEHGDPNCAIGRRPWALRSSGPALRSVGSFFASAAHLEGASVPAFRHLARELVCHGAPRALVRAALRSARDEVRHERVVSALARRYGATPARPVVDRMPVRSLLQVALDNATEGCVRETFGAAVAGVQARRSRDPIVRAALRTIARDEARHAALSWAIDGWARARLPADASRQVIDARRRAARELSGELARPVPRSVEIYAGMPSVEGNRRMFTELDRRLFTPSGVNQ